MRGRRGCQYAADVAPRSASALAANGVQCMIKAITVATIILVAAGVPPSRKAAYRRVYSIQRSSDRPVRCTTVTTPTCNCRQNPTRIGLGCGPNQVRPAISAPPRRSAQGLQVHHSAVPRLEGSIDYLRARVWPTAKNCRYAASAGRVLINPGLAVCDSQP